MDIKKEDAVLLFQKPISTPFNSSNLQGIEQCFHQLNDTLVQVKAEIEDPEEPNADEFNLSIKTENIEPVSNDTLVQVKAEIEDLEGRNADYFDGFNITIKTENIEPVSNNNYQTNRPSQLSQNYIQNVCPICRKSFSSFGKRKKHFMTHFDLPSNFNRKKKFFGRILFICVFCGKVCILKHEIALHCFIHKTKKLTKPNGVYQNSLHCSDSIRTIPLLSTIKNEIDIEYNSLAIKQEPRDTVPIQALKCEVCLRDFKSKASLNRHLTYHRKNHTCRICLKMYKSSYKLKCHQSSHCSIKLFKCEFCLKYYKSKQSLSIHKTLHCLKKSFKCDHCKKRYFFETTLHSHPCNPRCNSRSIECTDCGRLCPESRLKAHLATHTEVRPYKCELCPKMFKYPQDLKRHLLYHTGERPFKCNICQKGFTIKQHLTRHMYCHCDEKPFKCEICSKTYTQKCALVYHFRRHTSETPFKCNICSNAYTEKKMLDYHVLSHTGEKPFECAICSKRFKQKQSLKRHLHIHTGSKSVTCATCGKCFAQKQYLNDHLRTHKGEKPYQCNICLKQFSIRKNLNVHMRRHIKKIPG